MNRLLPGSVVTLRVKKKVPYGYWLTNGKEEVFLQGKEATKELVVNEAVEVFVFRDRQERLAATMTMPKVTNERYDWVEVVEVVPKLGVFVNIGISKDVLVSIDDLPPLKELWPQLGDQLYCSLKTDKRGRLLAKLATEEVMNSIAVRATETEFNKNIRGRIYRLIKAGSFMISDVGYLGFIHESERREEPRLGQFVEGRIIGVKEDGTVNVSLLPRKHESIDEDAEKIYQYMESRGGAMPYSDKSDPDDIQARFNMSKAAFKRALGRLMKENKVYQEDGWTYFTKNQ
jgi:predicted RNA-binding protein (virulence factor B family)